MRWEYKIVEMQQQSPDGGSLPAAALEVELNELGASEWELIAIIPSTSGESEHVAILKRPRTDSRW